MISFDRAMRLLEFGMRVMRGELNDPLSIGKELVGLALDYAPVQELAPYLTEEAARRADAVADRLEDAKLGDRG